MSPEPRTRMTSPDVSVIMTVRNGEDYVASAMNSVLASTDVSLELIVIDDGSTDRTAQILDDLALTNQNVFVRHEPPRGIVPSATIGCGLAKAPLLARLDADDLSEPHRLATQLRRFRDNPGLVLVGTWMHLIDAGGRRVGRLDYAADDAALRADLQRRNPFVHSSIMLRAEAFAKIGGYRPAMEMAEDYDLCLRLAECGEVANVPECLGSYRLHAAQISVRKSFQQGFIASLARESAAARARSQPDPIDGLPHPISPQDKLPAAIEPIGRVYRAIAAIGTGSATDFAALRQNEHFGAPERKLARKIAAMRAVSAGVPPMRRLRFARAAMQFGFAKAAREFVRAARRSEKSGDDLPVQPAASTRVSE
jgi:GT2 family glycosyltransferase